MQLALASYQPTSLVEARHEGGLWPDPLVGGLFAPRRLTTQPFG